MSTTRITSAPLTPELWPAFEALFGVRGACAGCWCMWPRLRGAAFTAGSGAPNKRAFHRIVDAGPPPGVLAFIDGEAVGWCAVAPRPAYDRLAHSRVLAPVDDREVWSIICFFIAREARGKGVMRALIAAASAYAAARGARLLEAYPIAPAKGRMPDAFVWHGLASAFLSAGFREVARRSPTRPIVRREVRPSSRAARAASHAEAPRSTRAVRAASRSAASQSPRPARAGRGASRPTSRPRKPSRG